MIRHCQTSIASEGFQNRHLMNTNYKLPFSSSFHFHFLLLSNCELIVVFTLYTIEILVIIQASSEPEVSYNYSKRSSASSDFTLFGGPLRPKTLGSALKKR